MQNLYNILSIIAIVILVFLQTCNKGKVDKDKTLLRTDTVTVVEYNEIRTVDTLWQTKWKTLPKDTQFIEVEKIVYVDGSESQMYSGIQEDSTVTIKFNAVTQGTLTSLELSYLMKQPKTIKEYVEKTITETKTITNNKYLHGFYVGSSFGYSFPFAKNSVAIGAELTTPSGFAYSYDYDLALKMHSLGLKYRIIPFKKPK